MSGRKRPLPDDFAQVVAKLRHSEDVRAHYNCGYTALGRWTKEAGVTFTRKVVTAPSDFAVTSQSMSVHELARLYRRSPQMIYRWIEETGVPRLVRTRPMPADFATVAPTLTGFRLKMHYGASNSTIKRWMEEAGVSPMVRAAPVVKARPAAKPKVRRPAHFNMAPTGGRGTQFAVTRNTSVHDLAVDDLRRANWVVYRCDERGRFFDRGSFWRVGNVVVDSDELLVRADRVRRKAA